MSLIDAAERFAAMDHSTIVLDSERCLHALERNSACEACFAICPVQAIMPGKPPAFDSAKCESCLACLPACPVGALRADDAVASLLSTAAHVESRTIELVCARNPAPEKGLSAESIGLQVKGCLAGLGTGTYVALSPFGMAHVIARTEACSTCRWAALQQEIDQQVERARDFIAAWGRSESVSVSSSDEGMVERTLWSAENPPLSRRDLFRMLARQGQVTMARAVENGVRTAGKRPGRDRMRLLGGVTHLPAPSNADAVCTGELGFAMVSVSEACSACGACARACPTEAIQFVKDEEETRFSLKFSARLCVGCDLCTRVCVPLAITVNHEPTLADVFGEEQCLLIDAALVKCKRCGTLTAKRSDSDLCDLCEMRRKNPFGVILPPGFRMGAHGLEREPR